MEVRLKMTPEGREAWLSGDWDEDAEIALFGEVVGQAGEEGILKSECIKVCQILVESYGSFEAALAALRKDRKQSLQ